MKRTEKKLSLSSLEILSEKVAELDVFVVENVRSFPNMEEPYILPHMVTMLCNQGFFLGEYDMRPIKFKAHDFFVVYPGHPIMVYETSEDYCCTMIIHSPNLYKEIRQKLVYGNSYMFHVEPSFHLSEADYLCAYHAAKLLKSVAETELSIRKELIINLIDLLSNLAGAIRESEEKTVENTSQISYGHGNSIVRQFYGLLASHYTESREVQFYAKRLFLSPKYFGGLIKKETGISAGQCIARYVVIRAKLLLHYHSELSIQQISYQLGFDDPASFSRYFKSVTGFSPKVFRNSFKSKVVL